MESTITAQATRVAAIYARVSDDRTGRGRSVAEQERESREACAANGWQVGQVYPDNDVSASRFSTRTRAAWERLVTDLDDGKYDVLVLWEPSRGSRDLVTWAALLDACRRRGVLVHVTSHDHSYDMGNPRDWRTLAEDGVDSAYESEKASKRISRSMAANAREGRPHGRIPYGYTRRYDPVTRELVAQEVEPGQAEIVREIVARAGRGEPVSAIMNDLVARGVPGPGGTRPWSRQLVRRAALSPLYVGERVYAGQTYPGQWPALVSQEAHAAARRVLLDPARTTTRPGKWKYLLSYYATCGVCGAKLQAAPRHHKATYFCNASHVSALCTWLDEAVERVVLERLADPGLLARMTEGDDATVLAAREQVAALRTRLAEAQEAAIGGSLSIASLSALEGGLLPRIEAAQAKAETAGMPVVVAELAGAEGLAERWAALPVASRRQVLRALGATVALDTSAFTGRHALRDFDRVHVGCGTPPA